MRRDSGSTGVGHALAFAAAAGAALALALAAHGLLLTPSSSGRCPPPRRPFP